VSDADAPAGGAGVAERLVRVSALASVARVSIGAEQVLWNVVEEHLDELTFLLESWTSSQDSPLYTFEELAQSVEDRWIAHADALAVGGDAVADALLWPALVPDAEDVTRVAAATIGLLVAPGTAALDRILTLLAPLPPGPARDGIVAGLGAAPRLDIGARVLTVAERHDDPTRVPFMEVVATMGGVFGANAVSWIERAAGSADPIARRVAATTCSFCPRATALRVSEALVNDRDPAVRLAAFDTALVHGSPGAYALALEIANGRIVAEPELASACMVWSAVGGDPAVIAALGARAQHEDARAAAIWALGFTGRLEAVDRLLPWLVDEASGPLAAEAIAGITGLGRGQDEFWRAKDPAPPVDDDLAAPLPAEDLDVEPSASPADDLPVPAAEVFARAWAEARQHFDPRQRHHEGIALTHATSYRDALERTSARRRHPIAHEIALRTRGEVRVSTRATSVRQRAELDVLAGAGTLDGNRPFSRIS
jgi:uncharacterized protein (TIGR02270 family)